MKNIANIFTIGCLLCMASYLLPWLSMNEKTSWSGYNISNVTQYFSDGKDFEAIFNLTHVVFGGSLVSLVLLFLDKQNQAKWLGLTAGLAGLIAYTIIKLGLHNKSFEIGFTLGYIGSAILVLQSFIGFFRKPLAG